MAGDERYGLKQHTLQSRTLLMLDIHLIYPLRRRQTPFQSHIRIVLTYYNDIKRFQFNVRLYSGDIANDMLIIMVKMMVLR